MKAYVYSLLVALYSCSLMGMSAKRALEDGADSEAKIVKSDMSVWNFEESEHVSCEPSVLDHFKTLSNCLAYNTDLALTTEARSPESSKIILPQGISCKQFARLSTYIERYTKKSKSRVDIFTDESSKQLLKIAQRAEMLECTVLLQAAVKKYASQMQKSVSRDVLCACISTPIALGEVARLLPQELAKTEAVFSLLQEVNQYMYTRVLIRRVSAMHLAYHPDGHHLASGLWDRGIRISEADTGASLRMLLGHTGYVSCLVYHPDGHLLASGSSDKTIRIWNSVTGEVIHTLEGHTDGVSCLAYHPEGHQLASGSWDDMRIWNSDTGASLRMLLGHTGYVSCLVYHPDGHQLASGSIDKTIRIWNSDTGESLCTLEGHTYGVNCLAYHPAGHQLASGSNDNTIRIWNADTGGVIRTLEGHTYGVMCLAYHPDGHQLASGSWDRMIRIWNSDTGDSLCTLQGHTNFVRCLAYHPDGHELVSGSNDRTIRIWNFCDPELKKELINSASPEQLLFLLYVTQKIKDNQSIDQDLTEHYVPGLPKLIKKFIEQYKS